jgi:cobalt-precorrin 5A hydrolase / precorrin-3B C17-methyltransferase
LYPIILTWPLNAVVVGGGRVGERKIHGLLAAGVGVTLISPRATRPLCAWAAAGRIQWVEREYQTQDLVGADLVFAATDYRDTNAEVARQAESLNILCNVADAPEEGSFHVPAVYRSPTVMVNVSTYGKDPAGAREVRDRIAKLLETAALK